MVEILVTGASGQQGGAVATALVRQNVPFKALSRDLKKIEHLPNPVQGDMFDREGLGKALEGVDRAYLMTTWFEGGPEREIEQARAFLGAARESQLKHLVFSSVVGAGSHSGVPHFESKGKIEELIIETGIPYTILRPTFFYDNLPHMKDAALPLDPETELTMVAVETIGEFAAAALINPDEWKNQTIELAADYITLPKSQEIVHGKASYRKNSVEEASKEIGAELALMYEWFEQIGSSANFGVLKKRGLAMPTLAQWAEKIGAAKQHP